MAKKKVGTITIGQSPRVDMVPEIQAVLGEGVEIIEGGALDGLTNAEVAELAPKPGELVLVTRLRDGSSVLIAEHHILPRMQTQIDRLIGLGVDVVAFVCTGEFPEFSCPKLLIKPQPVLNHFVRGIAEGKRVGVVVPAPEQIEQSDRWNDVGIAVQIVSGSPYGDISETQKAVSALKDWGADLIVLDCMGFSTAHKAVAAEIAGVPVILPRTVLARTLGELL